jgi:diguanylate cyclase (GGDEF)-like protein
MSLDAGLIKSTYADSEEAFQQFKVLERIKLLQQTPRTSFIATTSLALLIISIAYSTVSIVFLAVWYSLLLLSFCIRVYISSLFSRRESQSQTNDRFWLIRFRIYTVLTGWIWALGGVCILILATEFSSSQYTFMTFVLTGFFIGALLALSADKVTMLLSALPSLLPMYWAFEEMANTMAMEAWFAYGLFILFILSTGFRTNKNIEENIRLRFNAKQDELRLQSILNNSPIAASISSINLDKKMFSNEAFERIFSSISNEHQVLNSIMPILEINRIKDIISVEGKLNNKLVPLKQKGTDKGPKWLLASFSAFDFAGEPAILSWFYDITDRKRMEDKIEFLAYHDPLTQLPNRALFDDRLKKAIKVAKRNNTKLVLMFIDLDGFKPVNDRLGHDVGDKLLILVAERLTAALREVDTVARLGGDEFAVLAEVHDVIQALEIAEKVRRNLAAQFNIEEHVISISCSIGISCFPDDAQSVQMLLVQADKAMYLAKQLGRNQVKTFSQVK